MPLADRQKWDAKYAASQTAPREPSAVLTNLADWLPRHGQALDVAGGAGRNAMWLAQRGLEVTLADVSPVGLALARQRASEAGVSIATLEIDLEQQPLPTACYDLIVSVCYLYRPLLASLPTHLKPGGHLVVIQPTLRNLERHDRPPAAYLLEEGELPKLVGGLEVLQYGEGWLADDRHDAVLVARRLEHAPCR